LSAGLLYGTSHTMENQPRWRFINAAALVVIVAGVIYCLNLVYDPVISPVLNVLPPFAIALIIAFLLDPVVDWMQHRGLSREMGVAVVGLAFLIVFVLLGLLVLPKMVDQATGLAQNFQHYVEVAQKHIDGFLAARKPMLTRLHLPTTTANWASQYSGQIGAFGGRGLVMLSSTLAAIASRALWLIIIPMATFILLKDLNYIKAKIVHLIPERYKARLISMSSAVGSVFGKYVRGMMVVALLYSVIASIILSLFGLPYALIIGAVAGLFYLVPYLGNIVIIGMTVTAVLVGNPEGGATAGILALILLVQSMIVFDLIITPKVAGGSVGVHPVLALFSLALGAQMFGVVGMILAVPVVASIQVALGQMYPGINEQLRRRVKA